MRFDRFGPIDSSEEDEKLYREMLRKMTPEQKLELTPAHMQLGRDLKEIGDKLRKAK